MERWWLRENEDRALLTLSVEGPPSRRPWIEDHRTRWLNFDEKVERAKEAAQNGTYIAETFPTFEPNLGPDIVSTLFGLDLQFASDTSWGSPILASVREILDTEPNFEAGLWPAVEALQRKGLEAGDGLWITLFTDLHPNMDVLSALVGPETVCLEIADDPETVQRALNHIQSGCIEAYRRQIAGIEARGLPIGCWMRAFSQERTHAPQCDFSAMIGPEFFREAVLPAIRAEMAEAGRNIYHLDGPRALQHLPALLETHEIDAIQWVYGAGNGPARRWVPVYRQILDSGKSIRVEAEDLEDIRELDRVLGPKGVWYCANFGAPDAAWAESVVQILSR